MVTYNMGMRGADRKPDRVRLKASVWLGVPPLGGNAKGYALAGEDSAPGRLKAELHTIRNSSDSSNRTQPDLST